MYCEVLGLKTEYERRGEGRPILILHGWGSSIQAMAPVANCVATLGYDAVSLAFPCIGGTEEPMEEWLLVRVPFLRRTGYNNALG